MSKDIEQFIERRIVIGLIVSTEYFSLIKPFLQLKYLKSSTARVLARWCLDFYNEFNKSPGKQIEALYYERLDTDNLDEAFAEEFEEDILSELVDLFETGKQEIDVDFLFKKSVRYFKQRAVELHEGVLQELREKGDIEELEKEIKAFSLSSFELDNVIQELDLFAPEALDRLKEAFEKNNDILLKYPGALGKLINNQLVRGGFVALMAPEKRGKTFFLLDMAMRAVRQKRKVAFFQAGDMTEAQQLRRVAIYLTGKSDLEEYVGKQLIPERDCILNQLDLCDKNVRACNYGILDGVYTKDTIRNEISFEALEKAREEFPEYQPCHDCDEWRNKPWGSVWLKEKDLEQPLNFATAKEAYERFFFKNKKFLRMSTYPNGMLSIKELKSVLTRWKEEEDFVPDIVICDYADLLVCEKVKEFRQQQNEIWKSLRGISQANDCLVITATQTNAEAYKKDNVSLSNYSEDKRKYAHVTAMYGLSQDSKKREKRLGILRVNEVLVRDGGLDYLNQVYVLQSLKQGRAFLTSFI